MSVSLLTLPEHNQNLSHYVNSIARHIKQILAVNTQQCQRVHAVTHCQHSSRLLQLTVHWYD